MVKRRVETFLLNDGVENGGLGLLGEVHRAPNRRQKILLDQGGSIQSMNTSCTSLQCFVVTQNASLESILLELLF